MFGSMRTTRAGLALCGLLALPLAGCTSLLGDFTYDPNANASGPNVKQGDIVVMPVSGLVTSEQGTKATFTIVLVREPTAPVAIALASSNKKEGIVNPSVVSFTPDNYKAPQMVQITGVDDDAEDGPQKYTITTSPATSLDATYHTINPIDPEVTNNDDDTAGFTLTPPSGLVTTESGGEAKLTLQLNYPPMADVVVPLSSDNLAEGTVSPASLTFTSLNWNAPQVITVTGVEDDAKDGAQTFHVVTAPAKSTDAKYDNLDAPDAEVVNQDNDTAGVLLTGAMNLQTFETGVMTSFGVALSSPPTGDVTLSVATSDDSEGIVSPTELTFTSANWMAPQVISVTGVDDKTVDGDQPYFVELRIQASADADYSSFEPPDVPVINVDNDSPGLILTAEPDLTTSEELTGATFTVQLKSKPSGNVVLDVASSRMDEGVPTPPSLTFTEMNWDAAQVVTVMGVDDDIADGSQAYVVHVTPNMGETTDPLYQPVLPQDVMLTNRDDDTAGFTVTPQNGLQTKEDGKTATFTIRLNSKPKADVSIDLSSSNLAEGTVSPGQVAFTPDNWASPQTVTVRGVDDMRQDGSPFYKVVTANSVSSDDGYSDKDVPNVEVQNIDNDTAGITVTPRGVTLGTNEDGMSSTFTVALNSEPAQGTEVSFTLASSDSSEGVASPGMLKFTGANWKAPQTVTVKGVNDDRDDGPQPYRVSFSAITSADANYAGDRLKPLDVPFVNQDNDTANINVTGTTGLTTTEKNAGTATFQVALASEPTANVTIGLTSSRPTEGTVSPSSLTFTNLNWKSPQRVTLTGVDEKVQDGNQTYLVVFAPAVSNDRNYSGKVPTIGNVTVTNIDDDSAGVLLATPPGGLITTEPSGTATFTMKLTSQPTADVSFTLKSSNTAEATVSPASLTFTSANWNGARTVTLTAVNDEVQDGNQPYVVTIGAATSSDPKYAGKFGQELPASNHDNDTAKVLVSAISGDTTEKGGTATFAISLQTMPTADVKLELESSDTTEGLVSPASVTFTAANWASPQKITVTGVDDKMQDGDQPFTINVGVASSKDGNYQGMDPDDVSLFNRDDDTAKITVTQLSAATSESGEKASFTVVLETQPSAPVTLTFSSSDPSEGTLSDEEVSFTTADWASPKTVTVTGVEDDGVADRAQSYTVVFNAATSTDKNYNGKQPASLTFVNADNDSAGIVVSTETGTTGEDGSAFTFTIALRSKPTGTVKIALSSSDETEGTVSTGELTFTTANWAAKQSVTVTGVNDDADDGSAVYTVFIGAPTSTDQDYADLDPKDLTVTNIDDDTAGFTVSKASGNTSEDGGTATFTIKLNTKPTGNVTIPLMSSDKTEGSLTVKEVVLTPSDWNDASAHTITIHGEDDDAQDDLQPYSIITGTSSSSDPNYDMKVVDDVSLNNVDNDTAGYEITAPSGHTSEAGGIATFKVSLKTEPSGPVSIPISSSNEDEGILMVSSVDFTVGNWMDAQTVTVYGVDDDDVDGDIDYQILLGKPTSSDTHYSSKKPNDVPMTNDDDDSAALDIKLSPANMTGEAAAAPMVSFKVALTSKPRGTVTIPLVSTDEGEGIIVDPPSGKLVFSASDWDEAQTVSVQGVDDAVADMDQPYSIKLGPPQSTDTQYSSLPQKVVNLINVDDEPPSEE